MTKSTLELRRLIYGQSNVIVVSDFSNYFESLKEIEMVKDSVEIEGFIFKSDFADSKKLKLFTNEDWAAMFAQYALTYGWAGKYERFTGEKAQDVLQAYIDRTPDIPFTVNTKPATNNYTVEPVRHYETVLQDIACSKTVLREQQIRIINLMPIALIEKVFAMAKAGNMFVIKETEILFIKRMIADGSKAFTFNDPDQIVRFVVSNFRTNGEAVTGQLSNDILKDVKVKLPTSIKKKIWSDINRMNHIKAVQSMYKYHSFWKRLFKQIKFTTDAKAEKRFPKAMQNRKSLYIEDVSKANTYIEMAKASGDYQEAFMKEMKNPGQMLRNLLQYLRYKKGDTVARKSQPDKPMSYMDMRSKGTSSGPVLVTDVRDALNSAEFYDALLKTNTKLLWQVYGLIKKDNEAIYESRSMKTMNKVKIRYSIPLPGVDRDMAKTARKRIKNAIKQKKREENSELGNVYVEPEVANYAIQFTGREDTSISLSGEYLSQGSRINLNEIIPDKDLDKSLLRIGLAWRGRSCDIDLSMNIDGAGSVYYGSNQLVRGNDIIAVSSGDITSCNDKEFSTELIDIDLKEFKKHGLSKMFNSAVIYSGTSFADYECYWFMKVMKKKDRVSPGARIKIKLDDMDYAAQITDTAKTMVGLAFNIDEGYVEVVNAPMTHGNYHNANGMDNVMREVLANMPPRQTIADGIKMSINKQQLVDDIEFADLIISNKEITLPEGKEDVRIIHPGRDNIALQEILF